MRIKVFTFTVLALVTFRQYDAIGQSPSFKEVQIGLPLSNIISLPDYEVLDVTDKGCRVKWLYSSSSSGDDYFETSAKLF